MGEEGSRKVSIFRYARGDTMASKPAFRSAFMIVTDIDRGLAARGIRFDVIDADFLDGNRLRKPEEVLVGSKTP